MLLCSDLAGTAAYLIVFDDDNQDVHNVRVAPVVLQFIIFMATLIPFFLPWPLPVWQWRRACCRDVLRAFSTIVGYPFFVSSAPLSFEDIFVTDILTSATLLLWDFCYAFCHFSLSDWGSHLVRGTDGAISPDPCSAQNPSSVMGILKNVVYCLPFWMRLVQCLTLVRRNRDKVQLINAAKYFSAIVVVISAATVSLTNTNTAFGLWIAFLVIKTIVSFAWDLHMDWGLVNRGADGTFMALRPVIAFRKWVYCWLIISNLVGRASWALALSRNFCAEPCSLALGLVEIIRRAQWIVFRMGECYCRGPRPLHVLFADGTEFMHTVVFTYNNDLRRPLLDETSVKDGESVPQSPT
jgi:hypothetical protein